MPDDVKIAFRRRLIVLPLAHILPMKQVTPRILGRLPKFSEASPPPRP
jgi:hypothetical protein